MDEGSLQGTSPEGTPMKLVFATYLSLVVLGLGYFLALGILDR